MADVHLTLVAGPGGALTQVSSVADLQNAATINREK